MAGQAESHLDNGGVAAGRAIPGERACMARVGLETARKPKEEERRSAGFSQLPVDGAGGQLGRTRKNVMGRGGNRDGRME